MHMHIAWLYLLHAGFEKAGTDYRYRLPNGRYDKVDGEPKTWDLTKVDQGTVAEQQRSGSYQPRTDCGPAEQG